MSSGIGVRPDRFPLLISGVISSTFGLAPCACKICAHGPGADTKTRPGRTSQDTRFAPGPVVAPGATCPGQAQSDRRGPSPSLHRWRTCSRPSGSSSCRGPARPRCPARRPWSKIVSLRRKLALDRVAGWHAGTPCRNHNSQAFDSHWFFPATSIRNTDNGDAGFSDYAAVTSRRYRWQTPHSPGSACLNIDFEDEWYGWRLRGRHLVSEDGQRMTVERLRGLMWRDKMELRL